MAIPESVLAKLDHAKHHLDALNAETAGYIDSNPGEFVSDPNGDPNRPTFIYREKFPPPPRISLIAGDSLQALRSVFDYMIVEMVIAAGNEPTKQNAFPVCAVESSFQDAKRGRRLHGITAEAETFVVSLQPYTAINPSEHWLYILDHLANINKHRRLLIATLGGFSALSLFEQLAKGAGWTGVAHNANPGNVFTAEQVNMQGDVIPFVAFNEGAVKDMEVGLVTQTYIGLVTQVVEQFDRFF
jgi:hypothetical protein